MKRQGRIATGLEVAAALTVATTNVSMAAEPPYRDEIVQEFVVTGTRVDERLRLDTLSPVDVIRVDGNLDLAASTELSVLLSKAVPSYNYPRLSVSDASSSVRPGTLRGLSPDQTLYLVNSKRRHQSALVNTPGVPGRGSASVDLNSIPTAAIESIEVLRDGASAQYGSDAIAGVVNIRLREAREGGAANVTYGGYDTRVDAPLSSRDVSDGKTLTASGWSGFPIGDRGFLTISGEYRDREATSRGDLDPRLLPRRVSIIYGEPDNEEYTTYLNAGIPVSEVTSLYGWAGYQNRESTAAAIFRPANDPGNVPQIFPNGFLPMLAVDVDDFTSAFGVLGQRGKWSYDLGVVYGRNALDFGVDNTVNPSLGALSPTSFDAGSVEYDQVVLSLGLVRQFDVGQEIPVNLALGLEGRRETYQITAGDPASFAQGNGTLANGARLPVGPQGFPGFRPMDAVDADRENYAAYVDLEGQLTEKFAASAAARAERYTDFGSQVTGKLSARYDFVESFAVRGAVSTGFRAPGIQQQFVSSTANSFQNAIPGNPNSVRAVAVGTLRVNSPTARSLGARDLDAEESVNYSVGLLYRQGGFEATVDAYLIDIDDRIVLSENLNLPTPDPQITAILAPLNLDSARFFLNGVDTRTKGIDVVLRQKIETKSLGRYEVSLVGNFNDTEVERIPTALPGLQLSTTPTLFGPVNVSLLEEGTPDRKFNLTGDWNYDVRFGNIGARLAATYYSEVVDRQQLTPVNLGNHTLLDLSLRASVADNFSVLIGVDNLTDEYPDSSPPNVVPLAPFSRYSPFGFSGRFYFARFGFTW